MTQRAFELKLFARYEGEDNSLEMLEVELLNESGWEPFDLNIGSPGFLIFIYSIFTCQHLYLYINAAEKNIRLDSTSGHISVTASEDWRIEKIDLQFKCKIDSGEPDQNAIDYIVSRMKACPVSRNIRPDLELAPEVSMG